MRVPSKKNPTDHELDDASAKCLAEFFDYLREDRLGPTTIHANLGSARQFLVWLRRCGIPLGIVDDEVLRGF